jgi:hypothetical protein
MVKPRISKNEIDQQILQAAQSAGTGEPDPIMAASAPPGIGMTQPKGQWQWEQPPLMTDPNQAIDAIVDQFDMVKDNIVKLMIAGISVEEIVQTTVFNAFMEGKFSPDVAELIKPALSLYLMKLADDVDAPFKLYAEDPQSNEIDDVELFRTMKQRNPEMFTQLKENVNQGLRMAKAEPVEQLQQKQQAPQNFLEMGDV